MKTLKAEILQGILNTCVAFTGGTLVYTAFAASVGAGAYSPWDTLLLCVVLSATQGAMNHIPFLDNRPVLRALVNLAEVLLMGIWLFNWLQYGFWPLVFVGVAACAVFFAAWIFLAARLRQDAADINAAIQKKQAAGQSGREPEKG